MIQFTKIIYCSTTFTVHLFCFEYVYLCSWAHGILTKLKVFNATLSVEIITSS